MLRGAPGLGAHPSRRARLSAGTASGEGCGLANGAANSPALAVILAAGCPRTSPAKGHEIIRDFEAQWKRRVRESRGSGVAGRVRDRDGGGVWGRGGTRPCILGASARHCPSRSISGDGGGARGRPAGPPPGARTDRGRQSSPSRPGASPWLPSLTLPLELPGRFFFPLYKEKGQRARISLSRSLGLELFHQSQSSAGAGSSRAGCKGEVREPALLCWRGRDGSSPSIPLRWGWAGQTSQKPCKGLSVPTQIRGGPTMGLRCRIPAS